MRHTLPAALLAASVALGVGTADARTHHSGHRPERVAAHVSLHVNHHSLMTGDDLVVDGRVRPGGAHRVRVVVRGRSGGVSSAVTEPNGRFRLHFGLPNGQYKVRAFGLHDRRVRGSASAGRRVTVYRPAAASYYGPGLYGGALACGGTLQPGTLGVANKTLPCGTRVKLRYRGHTVTVPVVDRGPYVGGRDFDLTAATKERLHFPDLGVVLSSR